MPWTGDLFFDPEAVARADKIAILIPGALVRVSMFDAAERWKQAGYALVYYRFPGLDGRPLRPGLRVADAAQDVARFAEEHTGKSVVLLGYSTGGAIALTAAAQMTARARVALMSPAVEYAGGVLTAFRTTRYVLGAAWRVRSLSVRRIWLEYYKTLLFGHSGRTDPRAPGIIRDRLDTMVFPQGGLVRAHTRDLRRWRLPDSDRLPPAGRVRLFIGQSDPVFSTDQSRRLAQDLGGADVRIYPGNGHLLFLTAPDAFQDILAFFNGSDAP